MQCRLRGRQVKTVGRHFTGRQCRIVVDANVEEWRPPNAQFIAIQYLMSFLIKLNDIATGYSMHKQLGKRCHSRVSIAV